MNPEMWEYALAGGGSGRFIFRLSWNSENRARLATANQRVIRKAWCNGCSVVLEASPFFEASAVKRWDR
jgi:hypothetical protein